jgi:hypothetical protein
MSSLTTLPKGDSAWLLRKSIQRVMQQVSVLETNIGSSTTGNSSNTQVIFNDNGTLRGDAGLTYNAATDTLTVGAATITGNLTVDTNTLFVDAANNRVGIGTATPAVGNLLHISGTAAVPLLMQRTGSNDVYLSFTDNSGLFGYFGFSNGELRLQTPGSSYANKYVISSDGTSTWQNVGGVAGTAMTLNSTGLGVGALPLGTAAGRGNVTINGSTDAILALGNAGVLTGYVAQSTSGMDIVGVGATFVRIQTNGSARLLVDSAGNFIPTLQATAPSLGLNSQMVFNLTSNTNLRISVRGTDGTTRVANITLA